MQAQHIRKGFESRAESVREKGEISVYFMIRESIGHRHHFPAVVPLIADTGVHGDLVVGGGIQAGGVIFIDFFHGDHLIGFGPQLGGQGNLVPDLQRRNKGKTIPKDKLARVFQKFFRIDEARSSDSAGAGLGLAIAKEIVELHGGSISAESEQEETVFQIVLPEN